MLIGKCWKMKNFAVSYESNIFAWILLRLGSVGSLYTYVTDN